MNENTNKTGRNGKSSRNSSRRGRNNRNVRKEVEVNVEDSQFNRADFNTPGIRGASKSRHNDVRWYASDEALLRDAASFPFGSPLGSTLPKGTGDKYYYSSGSLNVPGVMEIDYMPTTGNSNSPNSPINIAARNIYSFVRYANSGHSNYDAPDLMMYLMAMDSAYQMYAFMVRLYGIARLYTPYNKYMPVTLFEANHVSFTPIQAELAQLRYFINLYSSKLASMCVPSGMAYFERHVWMTSGVYADADDPKAQQYIYVPRYLYILEQDPSTSVGNKLVCTAIPEFNSLQSIVNFANSIINPIIQDEDFGIMSGDLLKAFGGEGIYKVAPISDDYTVLPTYSQEVLSQIENLSIVGTPNLDDGSANIRQLGSSSDFNTHLIQGVKTGFTDQYSKCLGAASQYLLCPKLINMHHSNVTPAEVMVATRLSNVARQVDVDLTIGSASEIWFDTTGSELVTEVRIHGFEAGSNYVTTMDAPGVVITDSNVTTESGTFTTGLSCRRAARMSQFDWAPIVPILYAGKTSTEVYFNGFLGDIDNYTSMVQNDLFRLHEAALLSLFNTPQIASLSNKPYNK